MLCTVVRLLTGELWPRWEGRIMGVGPEAVAAALAEVCDVDLTLERQPKNDLGLVAESALQHKKQISLFGQPLDAHFVYDDLRRISSFKGSDSDQRKIAVLRGLFLLACPLEGKFIARTALRSMQAGLGPRTMLQAISSALACDLSSLARAFGLMPDLGYIAQMARSGRLDEISIQPNLPARFMLYSRRDEFLPAAYLPKFPGLRVQVHKAGESARIFTSQLRDISFSMQSLCQDVSQLKSDFVADADLIGFVDLPTKENPARSRICSLREMLRYINRRRLTRKSIIRPALLAYDLLAVEGKDICSMAYSHRRQRMLEALGLPQKIPFYGISPSEEQFLEDRKALNECLRLIKGEGAWGLLSRDPGGIYRPGELSDGDFIIRAANTVSAVALGMELMASKSGESRARFLLALRQGDDLVPIGRVWRIRSGCSCQPLLQAATSLGKSEGMTQGDIRSRILLKVKIRGAEKVGKKWRLIDPVIEDYSLNSSLDDVDGLESLNDIG